MDRSLVYVWRHSANATNLCVWMILIVVPNTLLTLYVATQLGATRDISRHDPGLVFDRRLVQTYTILELIPEVLHNTTPRQEKCYELTETQM